ncbi:hypothetical protein OZX67_04455 [Bifidobacterium sp. ESL0728]|uniref:hypothetical protein n=1 Tax=Bifidobacterium sp. ESL0728 TaxID=2983220 RepID=UPI0023F70F4A|nr:hypothetical protein [Bifidobacterium sp. ESL0728]WEV59791.1 hypothetical protein OZX67_04455 [Bifidobacterium sp. ESL0728]
MVKRIFWVSLGVVVGVVAVSKAEAYVRANTPDKARQFVLGPDQDHVMQRSLRGLFDEFNTTRLAREQELNAQYADKLA